LVSAPDADRLGSSTTWSRATSARRGDGHGPTARRRPPVAIRFNKAGEQGAFEMRVVQLYDLSVAFEAITFETADHREAVDSFLRSAGHVSARQAWRP